MRYGKFKNLLTLDLMRVCPDLTEVQANRIRMHIINNTDDDDVLIAEPLIKFVPVHSQQSRAKQLQNATSLCNNQCGTCSLKNWDSCNDLAGFVHVVPKPDCEILLEDKWKYLGQVRYMPAGSWIVNESHPLAAVIIRSGSNHPFKGPAPIGKMLVDHIFMALHYYFR